MSGRVPSTRHERQDVPARIVAAATAGLLVALVVIGAAVRLYERALAGGGPARPPSVSESVVRHLDESRRWTDPDAGRRERNEATTRLDRARWLDREHGVVSIPVDRAAELVLEEGLVVSTVERTEDRP